MKELEKFCLFLTVGMKNLYDWEGDAGADCVNDPMVSSELRTSEIFHRKLSEKPLSCTPFVDHASIAVRLSFFGYQANKDEVT